LKKASFLLGLLLTLGCQNKAPVDVNQLQGYWEIDFVQQEEEVFKNTPSQPLYDFYSLKNGKGLYKKVAPLVDGRFQTSQSSIPFEIIEENATFKIQFNSRWNTWQKTIKKLDTQQLILYHQERNFYYKRPSIDKIAVPND